jgi:hypothetical protein
MRKMRFGRALKFVAMGLVAIGLASLVVMALWNSLMPTVFALKPISFWQALGLLILSKIFFGGFRGRPGQGSHWRRMMERWDHMSPEEREKFRQGMRHRCGGPPSPEAEVRA